MSETSQQAQEPKPRHIGAINTIGLATLIKREVGRFMAVYIQTLIAPVITTLLFYIIFALAFGGLQRQIGDVPFLAFLVPGLIMMSMVQNAFTNSSSSLIISKVQGNIVDVLMPPLSTLELFTGFMLGAMIRGLSVGLLSAVALAIFAPVQIGSWGAIILFALLGTAMMGVIGIVAGIWAEKFDHMATVTNFVITPLAFLSGTFYSIGQLPALWQKIALFNPFFYMIDGFRAGFIGQADASIMLGATVLLSANILLAALALWMTHKGYKIKS